MRVSFSAAILSVWLALASGAAAQDLRIVNIVEQSGGGEYVGTNWKNGLELAAGEINEKGGILGRRIELVHHDNQTNPGIARAQMQQVVAAGNVFAIFGPVYSGHVKVTMMLAQEAEIPQVVGGEAAELTQAGNRYVFRTALGHHRAVPKIANYLRDVMKAATVASVTVENEYGRGRKVRFAAEMGTRGIRLAQDIVVEPGHTNFAGIIEHLGTLNVDAVFVALPDEEAALFLRAARTAGLKPKIIGEQPLVGQRVVELAGDAVNGVRAHMALSANVPIPAIQDFRVKYEKRFAAAPDVNAIKSYLGLYAIKHAAEKAGKAEPREVARALHGLTIKPEAEPGILVETTWDDTGDIDRISFIVEMVDGKPAIIETLPKLGG